MSERLIAGPAAFDHLRSNGLRDTALRQPHFVVHLRLADAESGDKLRAHIVRQPGGIASEAFGTDTASLVRAEPSAGGAHARSRVLPLRVDRCRELCWWMPTTLQSSQTWRKGDGTLQRRESQHCSHCWSPARHLVSASTILSSPARLAWRRTPSSPAPTTLSADPLLSRAIGFSAEEIAPTFGGELERLQLGSATADKTIAALGGTTVVLAARSRSRTVI